MGIRWFSTDSYDRKYPRTPVVNVIQSNPDPENYEILRCWKVKDFLVVKIYYPDCNNYEGQKILVYKGTTLGQLLAQKKIDPHFSLNEKYKSPIARFVPTDEGWDMAIKFCGAI